MASFRNKQFKSFNCVLLWIVWWNLKLSARVMNHRFVLCYSVVLWVIRCVHVTLIYLIMFPKCKSSDADNWDMPKRILRTFPLSEKVTVLHLIRKKKPKNSMLRLLRSTVRVNFHPWNCEKGKRNPCQFCCYAWDCKVMARVHNKCKDGNGIELGMKNMNKKCVPVAGNLLHKMRWASTKTSARDPLKWVTPGHLLQWGMAVMHLQQ